jgi:hypothetical protein
MQFSEESKFAREYARLYKRFLSLDTDITKVKQVMVQSPEGRGSKHWNVLHRAKDVVILKTRISCASLHRDALRLVYAYLPAEIRIDLIEIYFKGDKENEDRERIKEYLNGL